MCFVNFNSIKKFLDSALKKSTKTIRNRKKIKREYEKIKSLARKEALFKATGIYRYYLYLFFTQFSIANEKIALRIHQNE